MGDWKWWFRSQIRRLRESDTTQIRYFIRRHLQTPRRIALVLCAILFITYCMISSKTSVVETVSQSCLEEQLRVYHEELKTFSMSRDEDSVYFIGNGYIGVGDDGDLRTFNGKTLSVLTGFRPLVSVTFEGAIDTKQAILTDFLKGKVIKVQCFTLEGGVSVSLIQTSLAHRTRKNLIMEEVKIINPTKSAVKMQMSRDESHMWKPETDSTSVDSSLLMRDDLGIGGRSGGGIICSSVANSVIQSNREETFRLACAVDIRDKVGEGWRKSAKEEVIRVFTDTKKDISSIEREHDKAWEQLNEVTFHLSHSFAANVLNGVVINATRYAIMSNVRAPLLETPPLHSHERMSIESKGARRDLCYTGHSTLLYPSRLWTKSKNSEELLSLVDTWLLTLEKRGCANLLSMGASGVGQALVLSLSAATFHDGHLEIGMDHAEMARAVVVSGLEMNDATRSKLTLQVGIHDDNRPFLVVSSSSDVYACDGGCRSDPILISKTGTKIAVMLTKPLTSILYIAPNRTHLTQLRSAIHVSEIDVAPAHEEDVISAHKGEDGGLPTFVWVILGVILVAFHVFLIKLLYSEWKKGDSTPYNPFLRQKYFREH